MSKIAFVTGGSGGIGAETALTFASHGYEVVISYFHNEKLAVKVVRECKKAGAPRAEMIKMDITMPSSINKAVKELGKILGERKLDTFISNAGVNSHILAVNAGYAECRRVFDSNLVGPTMLFPKIAALEPRVSIFIGSDLSKKALKFRSLYCGSKGGLRSYVKGLAEDGHRVFIVNPNCTSTKMTGYEGRDPADVAKVIYQAAQNGYRKRNGSDIDVWKVLDKK